MHLASILFLAFLFAVFLLGVVVFKKSSFPFRFLTIFLGITLIDEFISQHMVARAQNTMLLVHLFSPLEFIALSVIYSCIFQGVLKKIVQFAIVPMLLFALFNSLLLQNTREFPTHFFLAAQTIYLFYGLFGLREILLKPGTGPLYKVSFFWLNTAMVLFSTTTFVFFASYNYAASLHLNRVIISFFTFGINWIYYILFAIAIIADAHLFKTSTKNGH